MPLPVEQADRLSVVLVHTRNPLNIGAAARAMSNFGFARLRLVSPYELAFQEARSAVGAMELLANAEVFDSVAAAVSDCTLVIGTTAVGDRELHQPVHSLDAVAPLIHARLRSNSDRVAILFGSEKSGLSNDDLSYCHRLIRIPTREAHISMNLGQAVAVCLYELVRDVKLDLQAATPGTTAAAAQLERMTQLVLEALRASGYATENSPATEMKVRRMVRRLALPAKDADVWLGMLRQILWKLRSR